MSYNRDGIDNGLSSITFIMLSYLLRAIKRLYSENIKIGLPASFNTHTKGPILFLLNLPVLLSLISVKATMGL